MCCFTEKYYLEERVPGESFIFHCSTNISLTHVTLYKGNKQSRTNQVLHVFDKKEGGLQPTYDDKYKNRVNFSGALTYLSVNITDLTEEDSGVYWCQYSGLDENFNVFNIIGNEVVALLVKSSVLCPKPTPKSTKPGTYTDPSTNTNSTSHNNFIAVLISIITAVVVFLMFALMLIFLVIPKINKLKAAQVPQNRGNDSVYEVMSTTLRRT